MFEKLGKFEIKRLLGHGAMGEVYLGVDPAIGREVAIKTILPSAAGGEEAKQRFEREARAAGVLNHPNLVTIYEFGQDQGVLFIAMEFVKGHDLEELLREQSLSRAESLEILAQVCDGLSFAHHAGIVHRDIKPSNVRVIRDGRRLAAKVMDFGVARVSNSDMTATGMVMGTVSYMAPEYIRTGKPDPRSDLFAVGVMLYESLSGRKPFAGDTTPTILYKIVNEPPEPISADRLQGLSPAIRPVLERALSKDPDQRYQTAEDLAKALRSAKDPTWQGQAEEGTVRVQTSAPTAPVAVPPPPADATLRIPPGGGTAAAMAPAAPAPPPAVPLPAAPASADRGRSKAPLILAAGLGAALVLGGGGFVAFRMLRPSPEPGPTTAGAAAQEAAPASGPAGHAGTAGTAPTLQEKGALPGPAPAQAEPKPGPAAAEPPAPRQAAPEPAPRKPEPKTPEPKTIDQPERFRQEKLETLETHERMNLGNVSMSEAIQLADKDPEKAIYGFRQAIKADPGNPMARAWLCAVLLEQGRYAEAQREIRDAQRMGLLETMLSRQMRFRVAYNKARFNNKIDGGY